MNKIEEVRDAFESCNTRDDIDVVREVYGMRLTNMSQGRFILQNAEYIVIVDLSPKVTIRHNT